MQNNPGMMKNLIRQPRGHDDDDEGLGLTYTPPRRNRGLETALSRGPDGFGNRSSLLPKAEAPQPQKDATPPQPLNIATLLQPMKDATPLQPPKNVGAHAPMKSKKLKKIKDKEYEASRCRFIYRNCAFWVKASPDDCFAFLKGIGQGC